MNSSVPIGSERCHRAEVNGRPARTVRGMAEPTVYFNPACSKCRTAEGILRDKGVDATFVRYLDSAPSVEELRRLMGLLAIADPRQMMRTAEAFYRKLDMGNTTTDTLLPRMAAN